jgi:hypothetical protein
VRKGIISIVVTGVSAFVAGAAYKAGYEKGMEFEELGKKLAYNAGTVLAQLRDLLDERHLRHLKSRKRAT